MLEEVLVAIVVVVIGGSDAVSVVIICGGSNGDAGNIAGAPGFGDDSVVVVDVVAMVDGDFVTI